MRLKIFLTPFALLIAVIVATWYIWPVVVDIQLKMGEVKKSQENLNATSVKKDNVAVLVASLDKNKDKEDFISSFVPSSKDEEKIVNGLNYLASDSGVNLLNISIADDKISGQPTAATSIAPGKTSTYTATPTIKFSIVDVIFSGKYENIKIFLSQIHKMEIINRINLLSISKAAVNEAGGDELATNAEIKFGYMPYINQAESGLSSVFSQSSFNFDSYSKINELIARKIPVLDTGQRGKANPFLP